MKGTGWEGLIRWGGRGVLCAAALLLFRQVSDSQSSAEYRPVTADFPGARSAGLGDAIGSDPFDIEGMYQNPAVLSFLRNPGLFLDQRHDRSNQVFEQNAALPLFEGRNPSFGLGVGIESAGRLTKSSALRFTQLDVNAAGSYRLTGVAPDLSLGVLCEIRSGRDDSISLAAAECAVGLMYAPTVGPGYSVVYRGIGKTIAYASAPGPGGNVTHGQVVESPGSLEMGSTFRFPEMYNSPFLLITVAGERDFVSKEFRLKGGIEATLVKMVSLRLGYVRAETSQLRCGVGISIARFSIDYAIMPSQQSGIFDEFALKIAL